MTYTRKVKKTAKKAKALNWHRDRQKRLASRALADERREKSSSMTSVRGTTKPSISKAELRAIGDAAVAGYNKTSKGAAKRPSLRSPSAVRTPKPT